MSSNNETAKEEIKKVDKKSNLPLILSLILVLGLVGGGVWYYFSSTKTDTQTEVVGINPGNPKTPTEAYAEYYKAVKANDTDKVKSLLSKDTIKLAEFAVAQQKKTMKEVLKNGLHETTFATKLPATRDERIKDNFGAVEVFNTKKNQWDNFPFVVEDGAWKVAIGNLWFGTYKSPGKARSIIERENANAASGGNNMVPYKNGNVNMNVEPKIINPMEGKQMPAPMQKGNVQKMPPPPVPKKQSNSK